MINDWALSACGVVRQPARPLRVPGPLPLLQTLLFIATALILLSRLEPFETHTKLHPGLVFFFFFLSLCLPFDGVMLLPLLATIVKYYLPHVWSQRCCYAKKDREENGTFICLRGRVFTDEMLLKMSDRDTSSA